jgi:NAD(P)H-flavin reductase/ferredoxin
MPSIHFDGNEYLLNDGESVLDCLLRHGIDYPHSCQSGTCQSCLSRTAAGQCDPDWQTGLKPTLSSQGYFLPCIAHPVNSLTVFSAESNDVAVEATIKEIFHFNDNVICLRLTVDDLEPWTPGRYLNLVNPKGLVRSYSIANLPAEDGYIELHIKLFSPGLMSHWLSTAADVGQPVSVRGPIGECFYCNPEKASFPIILAGTGTGLAPLIAIARDAIAQHHDGEIVLIHGGVVDKDLYMDDELLSMSAQLEHFHYERCTLEPSPICPQMPIDKLLLSILEKIEKPRLYVCGPEETSTKLKTKAFLGGVASQDIYSDVFVNGSHS